MNKSAFSLVKLYSSLKMNETGWTLWTHVHSEYSNCIVHLKWMTQIQNFENILIQTIQPVSLNLHQWDGLHTMYKCSFRLFKLYCWPERNETDWTLCIYVHSDYSTCIIEFTSMRQIAHYEYLFIQTAQTVLLNLRQSEQFEYMCIQTIQPVLFTWNEWDRLNTLDTCSFRLFNLYYSLEMNGTDWTLWTHVHSEYSNCVIVLKWMTHLEHFQYMLIRTVQTASLHFHPFHTFNTLHN